MPQGDSVDAFARAFHGAERAGEEALQQNPELRQKYEEIIRNGDREFAELRDAQRKHWTRFGDAVGDGGDSLWVSSRGRHAIQQNRGDVSTVSKVQHAARLANTFPARSSKLFLLLD